jgi:hypothetical protein
MKRTDILNLLAEDFSLNNYLEIGVQDKTNNFNKIECVKKTCVDPDPVAMADHIETSDSFFKHNINKFDLIFIDGLHHAEQVKRDFENALECLSAGGFIMLHDTCPHEEQFTKVPRATKLWYGDVYRFAMVLWKYREIEFMTLNADYGCTVIWKNTKQPPATIERKIEISNSMDMISWKDFVLNKDRLNLNQVLPDQIISRVNSSFAP